MSNLPVDYVRDATLHNLKNNNVFSIEYKLETNQGSSLVSVFINLTEISPQQGYKWLISIPMYNTCFFLPVTFSTVSIEEHLHHAKNDQKNWNKELANNISLKIKQILNEA
ncbi:hypothetical protein K7887_22730 (plasmid) [Sutcliffiella horikoshii]|uniref:hypothetical protein n=1 Tax=Sutcliffiella horikoshii TaxID=79883 RepID=UPI001CBCED25|nr:hypothetical protein [Sutcliffiella horikoshii]UAL49785.1 hypothetical protein K7887_22730 [Sutcliffiella horikoshii]